MRAASRAVALGGALVLAGLACPPAARADAPAAVAASPSPRRAPTYPLLFLLQTDAVLASEPEGSGGVPTGEPPDGSALRVRRARAGGDVRADAWRMRWLLEATPRNQGWAPIEGNRIPIDHVARLVEAFGAWTPHRAFQLSAGAQRVPLSLSRQVDEADLRLPERAQVITALAPDYRVGAALTSDLGLLHLSIAGMSADRALDRHLLTSGYFGALRLDAEPIGPMGVAPWRRGANVDDPWYGWWRFSAGVSVLYGTLLGPRTLVLGGDAQLQWRRLTVTGEYLAEHDGTGEHAAQWPRQGAVVEPGVFLWRERLELVLRAAWYRRPYDLTAAPGDRTDTLAGGAGLTLFAYSAHVRLQVAFEMRRTADALLADSSWAIFRATLTL